MANPNKRKGTAWESAVVTFLRGRLAGAGLAGLDDIRRQVQMGRADIGDVHAAPFVLECKNTAQLTLSAFVDQANREARNAQLDADMHGTAGRRYFGVAVVKRRGKGTGDGYAVMDLETFARVLAVIRANSDRTREP
ncbi:signal transduction protein with GAF and PtsI domain [Actinomadura coerulea]|uniref:Signal transduction protein with GAF and PtsI domain n=1 Tax=Actinomadura coerulea TaxID=46159 RepID=A0A7X0L3B1_9ACTN|nr:hypothetical protein [Actinomadura coerulea]MBB6400533.1 signal transduction protein with GAF and PtsI domain [Actinomadura coerulea]GGQ07912.1 hypothetical protein GCM10010187_25010 [Actinomadura coerulea]